MILQNDKKVELTVQNLESMLFRQKRFLKTQTGKPNPFSLG